jgi:proteasome component ECM29
MNAIDNCLDVMNESSMAELVPALQRAIKDAVGMPSKAGCARILVTLSTKRNILFKPYGDVFMKSIERVVFDRNATISKAWASAAGYLARVTSDKQLFRTAHFTKELYFASEGCDSC